VAYRFVRFQSAHPNRHGRYPGLFGVVNGLGRAGLLSPDEHRFWRTNNDWYHATLPLPGATVYDSPGAAAWFRTSATRFLAPVPGYLAIMDAHGLGYVEMRSDAPGRIVYEDDFQVIAVPTLLQSMPPLPDEHVLERVSRSPRPARR
jgi:hypothetical protein